MLCLAFIYDIHSVKMQKMSGFGIKECFTEASLGWNCFGKFLKIREFYTFNDKFVRKFFRESIRGGKVSALKRYFESNHCREKLNTI